MSMETNSTKTLLLDAASLLVQTRGYNGFSFHDLGAAVGITTASIHYHFPTKANLGQQLVKRYTAEFIAALGDPQASSPSQGLLHYVGLFRAALSDGRMCLCGMMVPRLMACQPRFLQKFVNSFERMSFG